MAADAGVWLELPESGVILHAGNDRSEPHDAGVYVDHQAGLIVVADAVLLAPVLEGQGNVTAANAVAQAYLHWGDDCASHLDGDFASVVVDVRRKCVGGYRSHGDTSLVLCLRIGPIHRFRIWSKKI